MSNDITLVQLQGLGLIGKIITGPWMSLVYKNATGKSNLEFGDIFQKAIRKLAYFKSNPESILYTDVDIFSQVLNIKKDKVHQSLRVIKNKNILVKILSALISYTETVLKRQMARYLTGNLPNPSKEMIKTTLSAPPHTMEAERILGMLDFFLRRAPNATFGFLDSKIKARVNKTLTWLDEKTLPEQKDLIQFVIRRGALMCQASKNFNNLLYEEIGKRCAKANLKKECLERKQLEKDIKRAIAENAKTTNPLFVNIDKKQKRILGVILKNGNLIGQLLSHKWELDDGNIHLFFGRIVDQKVATKKKSITYTIGYWKVNENEVEDIDISQEGVIADLILKDLERKVGFGRLTSAKSYSKNEIRGAVSYIIPIDICNKFIQAINATLEMKASNIESLLSQLAAIRDSWKAMLNEAKLVASSLNIEIKLFRNDSKKQLR
nr:uncharacterized protein LOC105845882 [Hydra vulgaris]